MTRGTRRELLISLGLMPALSLAACQGTGDRPVDLHFWGTGTLDIGPSNWARAQREANVRIQFTDNGNDLGPVLAKMVSGTAARTFDLGGVQGGAEPEMYRAGAIVPWDLSKIPQWDGIWDWVKSVPYLKVNGAQIGIPVVVNADSIIYRKSVTGVVDSYAAVFDPKFRGRASMEDSWMNSVIFTAIFMKENNLEGLSRIRDPGDLEADELQAVMEFLKRKKRAGQFYKFWSGWEEGVDLITSGKVVVMTGWEPIVYAARNRGAADVTYAQPREGYEGWSNNLVLHAGVRDRGAGVEDAAHRFVNWQLSGEYGCILGAMRGYMVPTEGCVTDLRRGPMSFFDLTSSRTNQVRLPDAQQLDDHVRSKFLQMKGRVYWQNARPRNYALYEALWAELRTI
ncbi:ABC transporter substrate-binding protein [Phenylobacterium sp.]|uniref:ABC transporter substrate-binding protein n=1 Tax=Phenylobacterium sp. TaxID=1871053 RepID=UPI002C926825|nr:extracellular solute-binding protein [Phenylobacterium sp.]HLZ77133.1 extracellular solute-binding protein [Phenylobacterium sp.]